MYKILIKNPGIPSQPQFESWSFLKEATNNDFQTEDIQTLLDTYNAQAQIHPEANLMVVGEFMIETIRNLVVIPVEPPTTNPFE